LDTVRGLIGAEVLAAPPDAVTSGPARSASEDGADEAARGAPPPALADAGVQFLEALANLCGAAAQAGQSMVQVPLPAPEVLQSSAAALRALAKTLRLRQPPS